MQKSVHDDLQRFFGMNSTLHSSRRVSLEKRNAEEQTSFGSDRATGRVSKQQWVNEALKVLASDGVEAVRVSILAKQLNISKSGFYWHFKDRDDLLAEMKRFWTDEFSQQIIDEVLVLEGSLAKKLLELVRIVRMKRSGKYDLAFASWAKREPDVRKLVDHVRDLRIDFVKELFAENGHTGVELECRARLFVTYLSWSEVMFDQSVEGLEGEPLDEIVKLLAGSAPN